MLELSKEKSPIEDSLGGYIATIYGEPKAGKTTLASRMPGAYFLATEPGHRFVSVYKSEPKTWKELQKYVELLCRKDHDHQTIVVDTVSNAYDMCCEFVCAHNPWKPGVDHISELEWGRGFAVVKQEFRRIIRDLAQAGFGIVFIAHEAVRDLEFKGMKRTRIIPNLNKSGRDAVLDISDMIGRIWAESSEKGGVKRYISFQPNDVFEAGDRTGRLSAYDKIELTSAEKCWADVVSAFKGV